MAGRKAPSVNPEEVFLNIPFDPEHERLYIALIAGLTGLGLTPRSVLEIPPVKNRLERLFELIRACGSSIHDLSRVQLSRGNPRCPRFNMPFEAGLAVAWAHVAPAEHRWFLFEAVPFRLQKSLSDLNGFDPFIHNGTVEGLCSTLTKAFYRPSHRPDVTTEQLLKNYRSLRPVAQDIKRKGRYENLFNGPAFRGLVIAGQQIMLLDQATAT
jgi:hypothetical protein